MNALVGTARLNAFRLNYLQPGLAQRRLSTITITQDGIPLRVRAESLSIHDVINDAPNTCTLIADHATRPDPGRRLRVVQGVDPSYLLFAGIIQSTEQIYVGKPQVLAWNVEAIDDNVRADWQRPFGAWEGVSATTVALQIISTFCQGFTWNHVQAGLPPVTLYLDGTERVNGALRLIAKLIGGYYYFEDYDLHLFTGDEPGANPDHITGAPGQLLDDPPIATTLDDSQLRTRCYGKGHAEATLAATNANDSRIPIANAVMFNAGGGKAISEWQRLAYTATAIGGTGALVGPGVTPAAPLVLSVADGSGVDAGVHSYAYTWVTAAGETPPAPAVAITLTGGQVPAPTFSVSTGIQFGGPPAGTNITYTMFIVDAIDGHYFSLPAAYLGITSNGNRPVLNFVTTADMRGRVVEFYRNDNKGTGWSPVPIMGGPVGSFRTNPFPPTQPIGYAQQWTDQLVNYGGGSPTPPGPAYVGPLTGGRVNITGVSAGPAGVTARKVYRTAANQTPLKLLTTWADNTTTSGQDIAADATLGATAPATDTSGLTMPAGQVLPGAVALPVSGTGWALPGGGWAVIGNGQQVIRYSGISGNTLTGIPASGNGAITAAVNYNSTITGAPLLLGVTGNASAIRAGAPINIWVQVDDPDAQTLLASRVGGTGIVEHLISDERRGEASLLALCNADLAVYSRPLITVRYATLDPNTRSGRPVRIDLATPPMATTLVIQDVTITRHAGASSPVRYTVTASNILYSLQDLLRRLAGTLEEGF